MLNFFEFLKSSIGLILLSSVLATLIPSPMDWLHFYLQNYIYSHRIKRVTFELLQIMDWYFLDSFYYVLILLIAFILEINNLNRFAIIGIIATILSFGAVIGIIGKFLLSKKRYKR